MRDVEAVLLLERVEYERKVSNGAIGDESLRIKLRRQYVEVA